MIRLRKFIGSSEYLTRLKYNYLFCIIVLQVMQFLAKLDKHQKMEIQILLDNVIIALISLHRCGFVFL